MRLIIFVVWCVVGFCLLLAGCSAGITAGELEASFKIDNPAQAPPAVVEVKIDKDSDGTERGQ